MQFFLATLVELTNLQVKFMIIQGTRCVERRNVGSTETSVVDFSV